MIHDIYPIPLMTPSFRLDLISRFNTTPCQDHLQDRIRGPNPQKERKSRTDDLVQDLRNGVGTGPAVEATVAAVKVPTITMIGLK